VEVKLGERGLEEVYSYRLAKPVIDTVYFFFITVTLQ
jgi:hypothetical protein